MIFLLIITQIAPAGTGRHGTAKHTFSVYYTSDTHIYTLHCLGTKFSSIMDQAMLG